MEKNQKKTTPYPMNRALELSAVELKILHAIKNGMTSSEIAKLRNCYSRTIEKHRSNIIKKLGIASSQNALLVWIMENLELFKS